MSKGQWTKETRVKQRGEIMRLRQVAALERQRTDDRVMATLEEHGPLSVEQVVCKSHIVRSTVKLSIERLRKDGLVRQLPEKQRLGKSGIAAFIYALGCEEDAPIKRAPAQFTVHRHPMDVALFGEYRRAAA